MSFASLKLATAFQEGGYEKYINPLAVGRFVIKCGFLTVKMCLSGSQNGRQSDNEHLPRESRSRKPLQNNELQHAPLAQLVRASDS